MTKKKKPYFPNNWSAYANSPDEWFEEILYDDFLSWKLAGWELPSSVHCLIRVTDLDTKKTKEFTYKTEGCARNKITRLIDKGNVEITVAEATTIHHLIPKEIYDETYD